MRRGLFAWVVALALGGSSAEAQQMAVPAEIQVPMLFKILTFDRKLGDRVPGNDIVIAIVFQSGYRASLVARDQVVETLRDMAVSTISGHPVNWLLLEWSDAGTFRQSLTSSRVDVIYVMPLRGVDLAQIMLTARTADITSFTGVPDYVERGLALGIGMARDRPQIIVNLVAARAEGSDFDSQLLRVSRVLEQ